MFGNRFDGKRIKNMDPFMKIIPYIMKTRTDSQNFFEDTVEVSNISNYVKKVKEEKGINLSYMIVILSALGRILHERPQINRFIMNRRIYQRKGVYISLAVKKQLTDDGEETTIKFPIYSTDTIFDIEERLKEKININKVEGNSNSTDKLAKFVMSFPNLVIKMIVGFLIFLDNHDMMPKSVIKASPFHTSAFLTNVGSLGIDAIYHHLYEFGTTSIFVGMGKKKEKMTADGMKKYINLKCVTDERICDGKYYASSFQLMMKYINNPELMEKPFEEKNN